MTVRQQIDVAKELRLPQRVFPVFGLCVGWPDKSEAAAVKPRLPQAAALHREQYDLEGQSSAVEHYNEAMAAFYHERNITGESRW